MALACCPTSCLVARLVALHQELRHHLGAEELGSIYESLLELVPRHDPTRHVFSLQTLAGNDRKTTGSYYTPTELVELVLDTALEPVLDDAEKSATTSAENTSRTQP